MYTIIYPIKNFVTKMLYKRNWFQGINPNNLPATYPLNPIRHTYSTCFLQVKLESLMRWGLSERVRQILNQCNLCNNFISSRDNLSNEMILKILNLHGGIINTLLQIIVPPPRVKTLPISRSHDPTKSQNLSFKLLSSLSLIQKSSATVSVSLRRG